MKSFENKLAVLTGGGTGIGRELARQLSSEGCHLAICDILIQNMEETQKLCQDGSPSGTRITAHECDVSDEAQVLHFRDAVVAEHDTDHINLLFNNAGVGGIGGSFLVDSREGWDRTFAINWNGVYNCSRAFIQMVVASDEGYIVNVSSVNGFWASLGPARPHTAYSSAKFAVKGFTEALLTDLRINAPHVKAAVVMPASVGTSIDYNTLLIHGLTPIEEQSPDELQRTKEQLMRIGFQLQDASDNQIRTAFMEWAARDNAPVTASEAASTILDGVRSNQWRILVGEEAKLLDERVRANPEAAYDIDFPGGST